MASLKPPPREPTTQNDPTPPLDRALNILFGLTVVSLEEALKILSPHRKEGNA